MPKNCGIQLLKARLELLDVIECGFRHAHVEARPELVAAFAEAVLTPIRSRTIEHWRNEEATPFEIRTMDFWWFYTIYSTAHAVVNAARAEKWRNESRFKDEYFYQMRMPLDVCKRARHAELDGFAALPSDPIWDLLRPPLDWGCMCMILAVPHVDLPLGVDPFKPGIERLSPTLLSSCKSWKAQKGSHLRERSPVASRPQVKTKRWYRGMNPEEAQAYLKRLGISVTMKIVPSKDGD